MPCECVRAEADGFDPMCIRHEPPESALPSRERYWILEKHEMSNRYFVRQGGKGWMVYDRNRKGPALIGTDLAANLTREQAEQMERILVAGEERQVG